jgi:hypothetical protein
MTGFAQRMEEDRRLSILLLLGEAPGGGGNEALLHAALPDTYGHNPSLDQVRADLAWLAEQGLVTTRDLSGLMVATITPRGRDVAEGRARTPGVARPRR